MNLINSLPEILHKLNWSAIFAGIALIFSFLALWFSKFSKAKLNFACSRWTALGLNNNGKTGAAFVIYIEVYNTGARPVTLYDFLLEATTANNEKVYYDPVFLFNLSDYIKALGQFDQIGQANNGAVPLPIIIPAGQTFKFPCEFLFMPLDISTTIILPDDAPFKLRLYARSGKDSYKFVAEQLINTKDIENLKNGDFSGVLSSISLEKREDFITARNKNEKCL